MNKFKLLPLLVLALSATPARAAGEDLRWDVSGPLFLIEGNAYWGAFVRGLHPINRELSVGGQSGFIIGSVASSTSWDIPLQAAANYKFTLRGAPNLKPFAGAALGLGILHASAGTASDTSVKFQFDVNAGTAFQEGPGLFAMLRLGVVGDGFLFGPSVGWMF